MSTHVLPKTFLQYFNIKVQLLLKTNMDQVMNDRNNLLSQERHRLTQTDTSGAYLPNTSLVLFLHENKNLGKSFHQVFCIRRSSSVS
jgi:hypothetical protein